MFGWCGVAPLWLSFRNQGGDNIILVFNSWLTFGSCEFAERKLSASSHLTASDSRQGREDRFSLWWWNAKSAPQNCLAETVNCEQPLAGWGASIPSVLTKASLPSPHAFPAGRTAVTLLTEYKIASGLSLLPHQVINPTKSHKQSRKQWT